MTASFNIVQLFDEPCNNHVLIGKGLTTSPSWVEGTRHRQLRSLKTGVCLPHNHRHRTQTFRLRVVWAASPIGQKTPHGKELCTAPLFDTSMHQLCQKHLATSWLKTAIMWIPSCM